MNPWDELVARIQEPAGTNVYPAMAEQIVAPAIVIVPADPWITSSGYGYDTEAYLAICLVESTAPQDGLDTLHTLVHSVRDASGDGWEIGDVSGVRQATIGDSNMKFLGSWVNVTFRNCEHTVEEGS
jgi:hypothetical protein